MQVRKQQLELDMEQQTGSPKGDHRVPQGRVRVQVPSDNKDPLYFCHFFSFSSVELLLQTHPSVIQKHQ